MYLLDTDHLGILQRQTMPDFNRLSRRMSHRAPTDFYASIVSFHEQCLGWNAYLNRARAAPAVVFGYVMFHDVLRNFAQMQVLGYDDAAANRFAALRSQRIRIGTMDLRIASIALEQNLTVLSRNLQDFGQVPGLNVEDWTAP
ncbi:MAG: type II toxin-antitoxin system VapC family toxin [Planctomycetaceae bacterium]